QAPSDSASCKPLHDPEQRREHAHVHLRMLAHRPVIMAIPWSRLPAHCNDLLQIQSSVISMVAPPVANFLTSAAAAWPSAEASPSSSACLDSKRRTAMR